MSTAMGMEFTHTRAALEEMKSLLCCSMCKDVAVDPVCLGRCSHFLCGSCLADYSGGQCPAPGCQVSAPARDALPHTTIRQIIRSVYAIGELLCGDEVPTRLNSESNNKPAEKSFLSEINVSKPGPKGSLSDKRRPGKIVDKNSGQATFTKVAKLRSKCPPTKATLTTEARTPLNALEDSASDQSKVPSPLPSIASDDQLSCPGPYKPAMEDTGRRKRSSGTSGTPSSAKRSLEKRNRKGETALHAAAVRGDAASVRLCLEQGADANTTDHAGWTPLHEAAGAGRGDIVELLLSAGANPNIYASEENLTPLHDAASHGHLEVVRLLIAAGADRSARNSHGQTPADVAAGEQVITALNAAPAAEHQQHKLAGRLAAPATPGLETVVAACPDASQTELKDLMAGLGKCGAARPNRQVGPSTTHCLVGRAQEERLAVLLSVQLVGCQLVQAEWLWQSLQAGQLVDTEPFQVEAQSLSAAGRERSLASRAKRQPRLLTGLHFYLAGTFDENSLSKALFQKLVELGGGKILTREPDPEWIPECERTVPHHAPPSSPLAATSHLIIYEEGGRRGPPIKYNMAHLKVLPTVWLVQSIVEHQLLDPAIFL